MALLTVGEYLFELFVHRLYFERGSEWDAV